MAAGGAPRRPECPRPTGAVEHGLAVGGVVTEIGSALKGRGRRSLALLREATVTPIVVEHRDRLARLGAEEVEAALAVRAMAPSGREVMRRCSVPDGRLLPASWFALDPTPGPWQATPAPVGRTPLRLQPGGTNPRGRRRCLPGGWHIGRAALLLRAPLALEPGEGDRVRGSKDRRGLVAPDLQEVLRRRDQGCGGVLLTLAAVPGRRGHRAAGRAPQARAQGPGWGAPRGRCPFSTGAPREETP